MIFINKAGLLHKNQVYLTGFSCIFALNINLVYLIELLNFFLIFF